MPTCLKWHMKQNITQTAVTKALCGGLTEAVRCVSVCVSLIRPTGLNGWEEAVRDTARPALTILTSQTDRWWFSSSTEPCVCGDGPALAVEAPGECFTAGVSARTAPLAPGHTLTAHQQVRDFTSRKLNKWNQFPLAFGRCFYPDNLQCIQGFEPPILASLKRHAGFSASLLLSVKLKQ